VLDPLAAGGRLATALDQLRQAFGLARVVLRDSEDRVLAVAPAGTDASARAEVELDPETLFALGGTRYRFGDRGVRLPEGGGVLRVSSARGLLAGHLWEGDAYGFDQDARQALAIAASMLGTAANWREPARLR
jgi:hypothetical protein